MSRRTFLVLRVVDDSISQVGILMTQQQTNAATNNCLLLFFFHNKRRQARRFPHRQARRSPHRQARPSYTGKSDTSYTAPLSLSCQGGVGEVLWALSLTAGTKPSRTPPPASANQRELIKPLLHNAGDWVAMR